MKTRREVENEQVEAIVSAYRRDKARDMIQDAMIDRVGDVIGKLYANHKTFSDETDSLTYQFAIVWNWIDHLPPRVSEYGLQRLRELFAGKYYSDGRVLLTQIEPYWADRWTVDDQ